MSVIKSFFSAFLMYSRIPMPQTEWKEENRRYALCFFPLIGVVIGGLILLWHYLCGVLSVGNFFFAAGCTIIPVTVTGGIHIDGFCDVCDALASCSEREKSLEIMKDPHIGSFAVIRLCAYFLLQTALFSEVKDVPALAVCACVFVQSRAWSGLAAVTFQNARGNGSLWNFSKPAQKKITVTCEIFWLIFSATAMVAISPVCGISAVICGSLVFIYYGIFSKRRFGGITGDLEGYFLQLCEIWSIAGAVFAQLGKELL